MSVTCGEQIAVSPEEQNAIPPPLVVDLDGTLVRTDLLIESVLNLLKRQPLLLFLFPVWTARGIARFKHEVARRASIEVATLPWRTDFIEYLRHERGEGRSLVLATGADIRIAREVADHLKLFDLVLATDENINLCGETKRHLLASRFGEKGFDYAADGGGGARRDLAVWRSARKAILVNPDSRVRKATEHTPGVDRVFADPASRWKRRLTALRPTHWLKNLLVFVPLVAAHRFNDAALLEKTLLAFAAFSCCASSGYLFNDLSDLGADRHHPKKRFRPFAAGDVPVSWALWAIPVLLLSGCLVGALVSFQLAWILLLYFAMGVGYSLLIKRIAILDVLFLAGLYALRIMGGSAAGHIWTSPWLLAFSIFLFFSLALVKRYGELVIMRTVDGNDAKARGYELGDGELLAAMGTASGYLAVLVLALYIAADHPEALYSRSQLLWALCPLLLYWISHVWLTAHRGKMHHDPIVFALRDRTSQILIAVMALAAMLAL